MLCGYAVARCGWPPLDSIPGLNTFVLYFALPCMLFRFGAVTPITPITRMADAGRIARIVLVSTGLAFLSLSAAVALFV